MPGYQSVLAVHRPSRTGVVAFANAYTMHGPGMRVGLDVLTAVLDSEPARPRPRPWLPAGPPPSDVAPLCGRWWWMGREYDAAWDGEAGQLVITSITRADVLPWRFSRAGTDRWRGLSGQNDGEVLAVRRNGAGVVEALDIATFIFTRDPAVLA
jgi:hypothetical protein